MVYDENFWYKTHLLVLQEFRDDPPYSRSISFDRYRIWQWLDGCSFIAYPLGTVGFVYHTIKALEQSELKRSQIKTDLTLPDSRDRRDRRDRREEMEKTVDSPTMSKFSFAKKKITQNTE